MTTSVFPSFHVATSVLVAKGGPELEVEVQTQPVNGEISLAPRGSKYEIKRITLLKAASLTEKQQYRVVSDVLKQAMRILARVT